MRFEARNAGAGGAWFSVVKRLIEGAEAGYPWVHPRIHGWARTAASGHGDGLPSCGESGEWRCGCGILPDGLEFIPAAASIG